MLLNEDDRFALIDVGEFLWTKGAPQGLGSTSLEPHLAPGLAQHPFLNPVVCDSESAKTPLLRGFREIAGAGFEPATFRL
jgi:hypothetical protein